MPLAGEVMLLGEERREKRSGKKSKERALQSLRCGLILKTGRASVHRQTSCGCRGWQSWDGDDVELELAGIAGYVAELYGTLAAKRKMWVR
jgi:hypothetical protein